MRRTKLVEMIPLDAPCACSYNCVGCKHLKGVVYYGNDDATVTGHCSAKDIGFWLESMARHDSRFANVLKEVVEKI